jgi:hypothetical protein
MAYLPDRRPNHGGHLEIQTHRQTTKQLTRVQSELVVRRAVDVAQRDLTRERMSDMTALTEHALDEGAHIARRLSAETEATPFAAKALAQIAETGFRSLQRELRQFGEG